MIAEALLERAENSCELCKSTNDLKARLVSDALAVFLESETSASILCCETCYSQLKADEPIDANHWRCLTESMWSQHAAVQAVSWQMLTQLSASESWATDALAMLYLDDELLAITQNGSGKDIAEQLRHADANGNELLAGDTVVLIKDLNVKGASFTAKRGTAVRKISLVQDNAEHIEGRVNDQQIVILTKFVKRA